ncbi:MAG: type II secretion system protein [Phycisphaerales bacterium]|nr:type II secretion system protein [Phycisphaerales bacterium]
MRRAAFTIVEILIVICVLAALVALGLVSLNSSRDKSSQLKCMANMRQTQTGITLMGGKDGLLPFATFIPFQVDGPAKLFRDMMFALSDATGVARPVKTNTKTSKGWWLYDVAPTFQCPRDVGNTIDPKVVETMGYDAAFAFAKQVFMSADYVPGASMTRLERRGMDPEVVRRTVTQLWEKAPWTPVLDELWQWHNYKSKTANGNASYIDGSVRQSDWGTVEQRKRWGELLSQILPGDS